MRTGVRFNRFARQLADLDPEERGLVLPVSELALQTFAGFEERTDSTYHKAYGLTPEDTWARVAQEIGRVTALTTLEGHRDQSLGVADIELIHRGVFEPVFGEGTLGFRSRRAEEVTYPIVVGVLDDPRLKSRRGTGGKQVTRNLGRALRAFEREIAALRSKPASDRPTVSEAATPAVKLYAKVIGIHPFFDGNGRTAWAVFAYALQRCGLVEIAMPPTATTRWALGRALRPDGSQDYRPLIELVASAIKGQDRDAES